MDCRICENAIDIGPVCMHCYAAICARLREVVEERDWLAGHAPGVGTSDRTQAEWLERARKATANGKG